MRIGIFAGAVALLTLAGCASSLPVRDFRGNYQNAPWRLVKVEGHAPFSVAELRDQRRLKVQLNVLAQAFGWASNPLVLLGVSDGIPSQAAHGAAARAYLAETGRPSCNVVAAAVSPDGREYEFTYVC